MGDTWIVNLEHFLDNNGAIIGFEGPARKLAEHLTAIVAMASRRKQVRSRNTRFIAAGVLAGNPALELLKPISILTMKESSGGARSVMTADTLATGKARCGI